MIHNWEKYAMSDEEYKKWFEEGELEDPKEVLKEEFDFLKNNWFSYITALAISLVMGAVVVAAFLTVMSWIYNG